MSGGGPSTKFGEWYARVYVVPRRWSVATLLLLTTVYAGLCAILQFVHAPVSVLVAVSAFLLVVALAQLAAPKTPRLASACAGVFFFCVGMSVASARSTKAPSADDFFILAFSGGLLGYLAGSVLAGLFLVGDYLQRLWTWWRTRT